MSPKLPADSVDNAQYVINFIISWNIACGKHPHSDGEVTKGNTVGCSIKYNINKQAHTTLERGISPTSVLMLQVKCKMV